MPIVFQVNLGAYTWRGEEVEELETNLVLMTLSESWIQPNLQLTLLSTSQLPRANTWIALQALSFLQKKNEIIHKLWCFKY